MRNRPPSRLILYETRLCLPRHFAEVYTGLWSGPRPNGPFYVGQVIGVIGLPPKPICLPHTSAP
jgi:hypothetical protein